VVVVEQPKDIRETTKVVKELLPLLSLCKTTDNCYPVQERLPGRSFITSVHNGLQDALGRGVLYMDNINQLFAHFIALEEASPPVPMTEEWCKYARYILHNKATSDQLGVGIPSLVGAVM
jgi:hypothetical protein